ncbi:uncharacterized protein LOC115768008 [Drosophila novamexicana]|uniref:uncharacterized protein LOC115768008 n=1 Tax=Drosophila novamexicana TaxID=47314 RepID=UPI0011E5FC2C|nr:uncharacterized protein LOC115768008 [Drosophila novamexicana]
MNPFKATTNEGNNNQLVEAQTLSRAARAIRAFYTNPTMAALLAAIVAASQEGEGIVRQPQLPIGQYMDFFMRHCIQLPAAHVLSRTVHVNATVFLTHCARVCSKRELAGRLLPEKEDLAESRPSEGGHRGHENSDSRHPANSPFNYVMKPKPFTVMCDEERFSRKHMQYKPVREPPVNSTDYAVHPLWRGIQLVDASDPNAVDFKGNYKLFTYHMDSTSNTLMPDIPFRSRQFSSRRNMLAIIDDVESSAVAFRHLQSARNNELDEDSDMAESIMFERPINNMNISDMSSESDELGVRTSRAIKVEQWNVADESSVSKLEAWQHAFVSRVLKAKSAVGPVEVKSEPTDDCDKKPESSDSSARFLDIPRSKPIRATPTSSDSSADESIAEELSSNALPTKEIGDDEDPDSPFNPNVKGEHQGAAFSVIPLAGVRDLKLFSYNTNDARVQQLLPVLPRTKFQVQAKANAQAAQIHGSTSLMDMQSYLEARLLKLQRNLEEPCSSEAANRLRLEMIQIRRELINIQPDSEESSDMDVEPAALTSSRSRSLLNDALDNMLRNISRDKATAMERRLTRNVVGFFGSTRPNQRSPSVAVAVSDELGRKVIKRRLSSNIAAATDSPFDFKPIEHSSAMPEKRRCEEPPTHPSPHTPHDDVPNNMTLASTLTSMTKVKADLRVAQHQLRIRMLTIHGRLEEPCTSKDAHRLHEELAGIREKLATIAEALDATIPDGSSDMDLEVSTTDCDDQNVQPNEPEALQLAATNEPQDIDFNESGFLDSSRLDQTLPRSPTGLSFLESTRLDERPQRPAAEDSSHRSDQPLPADSGVVSADVSDQVTPSTLQQSGHMDADTIVKELDGMERQAELEAKSLAEETAESEQNDVDDFEDEDKHQASVRHSTRLHNQPEVNEVCDAMEDQSDS